MGLNEVYLHVKNCCLTLEYLNLTDEKLNYKAPVHLFFSSLLLSHYV